MIVAARVSGVTQHGDEALPKRCTKCHHPWTSITENEAHCRICGTICYRLVGVIGRASSQHPPAHHKVKPSDGE